MGKSPDPNNDNPAGLTALRHPGSERASDLVRTQFNLVNRLIKQKAPEDDLVREHRRLAYYLNEAGDFRTCSKILAYVVERRPEDINMRRNLGVVLGRIGEHSSAIGILKKVLEVEPDDFVAHDALAGNFANLREFSRSAAHGEKSLLLKDAAHSGSTINLATKGSPPPFDHEGTNIIAFSLFGSADKYLLGALANARRAPEIYPGWRCRYYCSADVPIAVTKQLAALGANVVEMPPAKKPWEELFWRFHVAEDKGIDRFLVRDADAVINQREAAAVAHWLSSGDHFHAMRDWYTHTELMLAGMWGGVGQIQPISSLRKGWRSLVAPTKHDDQLFLRECVWPLVRSDVLVHDSIHRAMGALQFPEDAALPPDQQVGQNMSLAKNTR